MAVGGFYLPTINKGKPQTMGNDFSNTSNTRYLCHCHYESGKSRDIYGYIYDSGHN